MPLPLAAVPLIAQGAAGLGQFVGGLFGRNKARKDFENAELPSIYDSRAYETAQTTENLAERFAQQGLPEQTMRFQEDMISRSGAAALNSLSGLRGLQSVGGIATSLADQYRQLASMDAQQRIANRGQWFDARQNVQGLEQAQAERDYGQALNKQAASLARMTANQQNIQSGLGALYGAGNMAMSAAYTPQQFGGFLNTNKNKNYGMAQMRTIGANTIGSQVQPQLAYPD